MKIAVEGCAHGELETIYDTLEDIKRRNNIEIDLLICCGDFQAVRNEVDLACMAVPPKYRKMCSFYKYYNGEKTAPILTIFIGGNHEASNHLWELPFGGWVAPNIYYLGYSGVVNFGGLRIAGLSGIYKSHDYNKGHYESPPFNQATLRSVYHVRSLDVFKLKLLTQPIDIALSHDWPKGVYHYGNLDQLYQRKGFLREDIESGALGSYAAQEVLKALQPNFWFSAHLHCKFPAQVVHSQTGKVTNFLALDKCLPRRKYLEVIDVGEAKGPLELTYDTEWLAITKSTIPLLNTEPVHTNLPCSKTVIATLKPNEAALEEVKQLFDDNLRIPMNFTPTVALYNPDKHQKHIQVTARTNLQTDEFCRKLKIRNPFWATDLPSDLTSENPDEISLSDDDDSDVQSTIVAASPLCVKSGSKSDSKTDEKTLTGSAKHLVSDYKKQSCDISSWLPGPSLLAEIVPKPNMLSESVDEIGLADDEESESQNSDFRVQLLRLPKNSTSDLYHHESGNDEQIVTSELEDKISTDINSDSEPPSKIFKLVRRNQNMYSTTEDSDD